VDSGDPDEGFDCLAFKWDVRSRIYEEIKDLSAEEQIAYFRRRAAWFASCRGSPRRLGDRRRRRCSPERPVASVGTGSVQGA
jgi:hypothetical protein